MPLKLGGKPEHGFDQPLGLLSDCHRRIENFLSVLIRVVERCDDGRKPLSEEERQALETALRYFKDAAPRHTQDEEESLFPRMRASDDPAAHAALERIASLESDHRHADAMHEQVDTACRRWLEDGTLTDAPRLRQLLHDLRETYARHIAVEDSELFPLAGRVLDRMQLAEIGAEMARRRGLDASKLKI